MTADRAAVAQRLRARLLDPAEAMAIEVSGRTQAAVLVPLYLDAGRLHAVFTERRDDLRRHPGEISFPGGRRDPDDADLLATALREAEEEIGLPTGDVEVLGALQPTPTIATDYAVYPFVGLIERTAPWATSADEVAAVLELAVDDLRTSHQRRFITRRGLRIRTDAYVVGETLIWGATARMLGDLLARLDAGPAPTATSDA